MGNLHGNSLWLGGGMNVSAVPGGQVGPTVAHGILRASSLLRPDQNHAEIITEAPEILDIVPDGDPKVEVVPTRS